MVGLGMVRGAMTARFRAEVAGVRADESEMKAVGRSCVRQFYIT